MVTTICNTHAQLLAASHVHRGEQLRVGGGWLQWKLWLVATEVLQRKAVMTAVRVGAWKSERNGIMPARRLRKTKKLHCSGSCLTGPPFMGWSGVSPVAHWVGEEKAQGCRIRMQGSLGRQAWKGAACPCSAERSPGALAHLRLTSGAELLTNTEAQEFFSDM